MVRLGRISLSGATPRQQNIELVKSAVYLGLAGSDGQREVLCGLLSSLQVLAWIHWMDIEKGFRALLARVDDVALDYPAVERDLAAMLVYLVQDDAINEGESASAGCLGAFLSFSGLGCGRG